MPPRPVPSIVKTPAARAVWAKLVAGLRDVGVFETEEKKTSIHVVHGRAFVGVHPRATGLVLQIVTDAPIRSRRVTKVEQTSARRFHNTVKLEDAADVDRELLGWIARAHALTA